MARRASEDYRFAGFAGDAHMTRVPDVVFDELLPHLCESELKVLLYIIRRTSGFNKTTDRISLTQFLAGIVTRDGRVLDRGCGIRDRATVIRALQSLARMGIITRHAGLRVRGKQYTTGYSLRIAGAPSAAPTTERCHAPAGAPTGTAPVDEPSPRDAVSVHGRGARVARSAVANTHQAPPAPPAAIGGAGGAARRMDRPGPVGSAHPHATGQHTETDPSSARRLPTHVADAARRGPAAPPHPADRPETPQCPHDPAARQRLAIFVEDFRREFHDQATLAATTSRLANLYHRAGVPLDTFVEHLYAARATTQERTAAIRTPAGAGPHKNKTPYFFAVLEERLGLRAGGPSEPPTPAHPAPETARLADLARRVAAVGVSWPEASGLVARNPELAERWLAARRHWAQEREPARTLATALRRGDAPPRARA